jgi:hypothetical protein
MEKLMVLFSLVSVFALSSCGLLNQNAGKSDAQSFYEAALAAQQNQKPLLLIEGQEGQPVVISGLKSLAVYAPNGATVSQYADPWAGVVNNGLVAAAGLGSVFLSLDGSVKLAGAIGSIAGHNINYGTGSYQGMSGPGVYQSPNSGLVNGSPTGSPASPSNAPNTSTVEQPPTVVSPTIVPPVIMP